MHVDDFSLDNTLQSSFACYLFETTQRSEQKVWTGIVEPIRGVTLIQDGNTIRIAQNSSSRDSIEYISKHVLGTWFHYSPEKLGDAKPAIVKIAQDFLPGIRVPRLHRNKWQVLVSAMLSVHARMSLSRAWFRSIADLSLMELSQSEPIQLRDRSKQVTGSSAGYRMRYLVEMASSLRAQYLDAEEPLEELCSKPLPIVRMSLLNLRNVGPKVADCFLLNALGDVTAAPVDIHVRRVCEDLNILPKGLGQPQPTYCRRFVCSVRDAGGHNLSLCPKAERTIEFMKHDGNLWGTCIRAALSWKFEEAGWVQALLFRFGQEYCARAKSGRQEPLCPLDQYCSWRRLQSDTSVAVPKRSRVLLTKPRLQPMEPKIGPLRVLELFPEMEQTVSDNMKERYNAIKETNVAGVGRSVMFAVCLWLACKSAQTPALFEEVAAASAVPARSLFKALSRISRELDIAPQLLSPEVYVNRLTRELELPNQIKADAILLAAKGKRDCTNPLSLAAASVYLACQKNDWSVLQRTIVESLRITEVTLRNNVKKLKRSMN